MKLYLKPEDISPKKAVKIVSKLNSFHSVEQLHEAVLESTQEMLLTRGDARRILNYRNALGEFQDLRQVANIQRIGVKKFDSIVRALGSHAFQEMIKEP